MNITVPQTYKYLHFITPFALDTIDHDPWPKGHAWREAGLKPGEPRDLIKRRPLAKCNPAWDAHLGSEDDQRPETLYMLIQEAYSAAIMLARFEDANATPDFTQMRTLFAAFWVFRGFILNTRHTWDWSLLPAEMQALIPEDCTGPK